MAGQKREARLRADDPAIHPFKRVLFLDGCAGQCPCMTARVGITRMLQTEGTEVPAKVEFAAFQRVGGEWNVLPRQVVRGVHVGFLILMTFGLIGNFTAKGNAGRAAGWLIGSAGFLCGLYQWIFYADLIARDGDPTRLDLVVGTLLAVLIFEGTRRLMGLALPLMCGACILYWCFGQYLPAPL